MKQIDNTPNRIHASTGRGNNVLQLQTMTMGSMTLDVAMIGDEPWFYAPSLARTLEYKDAYKMLRMVKDDEKAIFVSRLTTSQSEHIEDSTTPNNGVVTAPNAVQLRPANFVNESGFYRLVFRSESNMAEAFRQWVFKDVLPSLRKTGQYKLIQEAKQMGISFDFTDAQWEWLKLHPYMLDILPLAAAGYNSVQITRMLNYNTPTGITARKQIDKLKELGFLPKEILPRALQLEQRIKAERSAVQPQLTH